MFLFTKRPGERTQLRFMPGCLVMSLLRRRYSPITLITSRFGRRPSNSV